MEEDQTALLNKINAFQFSHHLIPHITLVLPECGDCDDTNRNDESKHHSILNGSWARFVFKEPPKLASECLYVHGIFPTSTLLALAQFPAWNHSTIWNSQQNFSYYASNLSLKMMESNRLVGFGKEFCKEGLSWPVLLPNRHETLVFCDVN